MDDIKVYTVKDLMSILKVSRRTLYNYISSNQIKTIKLGREHRVTEEALREFLSKGTDKNYLEAAKK